MLQFITVLQGERPTDNYYLYNDLSKASSNLNGFNFNDEIASVFRDDSWGVNKYRATCVDRSSLPGGRFVTSMYESSDLLTWAKYGVVFDIVTNPYTVGKDCIKVGSTYYLLYFGPDGYNPNPSGNGGEQIGLATSSDLINWTDQGWILIPKTSPVPANVTRLFPSAFIYYNSEYWLYIDESKGTTDYNEPSFVALYKSIDLITFTRQRNVISRDVNSFWEKHSVYQSSVFYANNKFNLYYTGDDGTGMRRIGFASSNDGINFTKYAENPVLTDIYRIGEPVVFFDTDQSFHFFYRYNDLSGWISRKAVTSV